MKLCILLVFFFFFSVLKDLKYADTHEWVKVEGDSATVGITDHAQVDLFIRYITFIASFCTYA